ncbi:MAG: NAD(P)-dependent oxidoreductase [Phascolarctobacterium sp.]|nr:NAD(P)-dependent oxidoreductase [Phascolarctobacterium sp.]MBQ7883578.1 NAD(P)-dependent oxidoreductase [Phascolarctobacterium sp.]
MSTAEAIKEARRCLNCARPTCRTGCPIENNIPEFIRALGEGNIGLAYETISERSNLPAICGRVCPHERQCEAHCILTKKQCGIEIGSLEMFIADFAHDNDLKPIPASSGMRGKVAVIGSGPAGLTVAGDLAKMDFDVTIFEAQTEPGGVLLFGIPDFRLPKDVVRREIKELLSLGVKIKTQVLAGVDFTVDDLFAEGFDAIFMGTGTSLPRTLDIPGKELSGILTATYFLRTVVLADEGKLDESETILHTGDNVVIVGAGNVAMDAARTAVRRGAKNVTVVFHKSEAEVSAFRTEYNAALQEGIQFSFLKQPIAYFNKKQMRALNNIRRHAEQGDETQVAGLLLQNITKTPDGEFVSEGGQEVLPCDCVILAVGQRPAARIVSTTKGIQVDNRGFVITRERPYGMTTRAGVFSSGDVVHGPATVVLAMKESKKVAAGIAQYIDAKKLIEDCSF